MQTTLRSRLQHETPQQIRRESHHSDDMVGSETARELRQVKKGVHLPLNSCGIPRRDLCSTTAVVVDIVHVDSQQHL